MINTKTCFNPNSTYCYCKDFEKIENYENAVEDKTQMWECHHRLETHFSDGTPRPGNAFLRHDELIALGMYYDRPPEELIFLTRKEHSLLHGKDTVRSEKARGSLTGHTVSDETRKKISEANRGKKRGKSFKRSDAQKEKLRAVRTGLLCWTDGTVNVFAHECPEGFHRGMTKGKKGGKKVNGL